MNKRTFLKLIGSATLLRILAGRVRASTTYCRRRPSDAAWPLEAAWKQLNDAAGGSLIRVDFPLSMLKTDPESGAAKRLLEDLKNPYYIGDQAGLTQTLGWVDAWATRPSVYAVAARSVQDIAAAVNFARENRLRLGVKGGGHSFQGTSNAPDSLLIWTRHMNEITMHAAFVPQGCERTLPAQPAVTVGAGVIGMQAYTAVTTRGGKYVQRRSTKDFWDELHTVTSVDVSKVTLDGVELADRGALHLDQGIVVTSYASQGKTVDQVIVSVPVESFSQANEAQFYVSMSRARKAMHLFTDSKVALREAVACKSARLSFWELIAGGKGIASRRR
jgi:hypothetical protein